MPGRNSRRLELEGSCLRQLYFVSSIVLAAPPYLQETYGVLWLQDRGASAQRLVDQFALIVAPVALGKGLSLFSELAAPTPLELMSSKAFPGSALAPIYRAA
jgi:dihydrofolate reductase